MPSDNNIRIFDTTMRDGELTPGVKMSMTEKISIAKLLEEMGVDVIEVGYPGKCEKDFDQVWNISKFIKNIVCGLASSNEDEIISVAKAIEPAQKGRINIYTNVNIKDARKEQVLETIQNSVCLAKHYCDDVQWSAFDATRSKPDFLCQAVEVAINSGATTISIPDSLGIATPKEFSQLVQSVVNRVSNINTVVSVHCHDDLGLAVDNSIAALECGVRQIECAINGLGARKGNADLERVTQVLKDKNYQTRINTSLINQASELVTKITGIEKKAVSYSNPK